MKSITAILSIVLLTFLLGCGPSDSFICKCDKGSLSYNDSLIIEFLEDTASANFQARIYNLEPLNTLDHESYRLIMSHSFSRYTQIYTLSQSSASANLEIVQYFSPKDRTKKIQLDEKYQVKLTEGEWVSLKTEIDTSCYWTNQIGGDLCQGCTDGGTWRLEGYDPEKQNCAERNYTIDMCDYGSKSKLGDLCRTIRKYAKEEKLEIY